MIIEVLYPEICNLYGELANIRLVKESAPEITVVETLINEKPKFLTEKVDLVYIGTMSENSQLLVMEKLAPYMEELKAAVEKGQYILATGNAHEIFAKEIKDTSGETIQCLGLFDYTVKRNMRTRYNSLYVGMYKNIPVVGFKSQFTHSYYNFQYEPLFMTERGPGFNPDIKEEGIRYKNFMGTYIIGPLFVLNPLLMEEIMHEIGDENFTCAHREAAVDAYNFRLEEYRDPKTGFYY